MKALVTYDSLHGNTEKIAHAISDGLAGAGAPAGAVAGRSRPVCTREPRLERACALAWMMGSLMEERRGRSSAQP